MDDDRDAEWEWWETVVLPQILAEGSEMSWPFSLKTPASR